MAHIHFQSVRWRNLFSYGDTWTTVQLDRSPSTLVIGKNGHGKCLAGDTTVDVRFKSADVERLFVEFAKSLNSNGTTLGESNECIQDGDVA